ncbi:isoprenylcysteine carboxylmethyltransferase family protein [Sphingomonas sp. HITSZ_GF]|uniref:methanethiol S-methyltransferase n=1 Tax=Sphingomonas sp. HITSZ_GF TaxID=3037247 RepID=UPI00240E5F6E|nr:methanethiol S-methyltransferase [Sphingomonas sp. HITSZ_GF]MDG2532933.1 isoprenylcysteine carboxylmethyltransferase family protein [Sphingomonas sp. HITSZ_GF]
MPRVFFVLFSLVAYAIFLAIFLYLVGFVANFAPLPHTIDRGPIHPWVFALLVDIGLIALFGIQHSVMARQGFKQEWTRIVPAPIERSMYLVATSAVLALVFWLWLPIPAPIWNVTAPAGFWLLTGLSLLGWGIVLTSTYLINHFELFGLQQTWLHLRGKQPAALKLRTPLLYKLVRHPLYSGFLLAFWATPAMTVGHLLFTLGMTAYILIGVHYEERDLGDFFGEDYAAYQRKVGAVVPGVGRK